MARFFVDRPIVAMVIAIITVIVGVVSMRGLPEAQFPEIVPPQIIVTTTYPGADAITMEQAVASPIEQQTRCRGDGHSRRLQSHLARVG